MLPNIDVTNTANLGGASPAKRPEPDQVVQDSYKSLSNVKEQQPKPKAAPVSNDRTSSATDVVKDSRPAENVQQTQKAGRSGTRSYDRNATQDQAEINFQLTREERDVFLNVMSGREEAGAMTEEEQTTLQKVSERIEKLIEDADAKDSERAERLEKAVKEWYNRLSNGKHKAPVDLIRLIHQAAMGVADLSKLE